MSDQKSLKDLLQQMIQTLEQQLYVRKLMMFKFSIEYKTRVLNKATDALRRDEGATAAANAALFVTVEHPIADVIALLRQETATATDLVELHQKIDDDKATPNLSFCD